MEFGDESASLDQRRDTGFDGGDGDGFCFRDVSLSIVIRRAIVLADGIC
jgi:hypothetical protein